MECLAYLFASARGCGHGIPCKVLERVKGDADGVVHSKVDEVAHLLQPLVLDCDWHLRIGRADLGTAQHCLVIDAWLGAAGPSAGCCESKAS